IPSLPRLRTTPIAPCSNGAREAISTTTGVDASATLMPATPRPAPSPAPRQPAHTARQVQGSRHWSLAVSKRPARWLASRPCRQGLAEQARRWTRRLPGSLLPRSGGWPARPVGRQVAFLDRSGLVSTRSPPRAGPASVRQALSSSAVCGGTPVLGHGSGALYRY